jgi:Carboxypeptidase regulatory-like domain
MTSFHRWHCAGFGALAFLLFGSATFAQSSGTSGSINGTVLDPSGAVVPKAAVEIHDSVGHFDRSATTENAGSFSPPQVPFNPYHMTVSAAGFAATAQDVEVRSGVPVGVKMSLPVSGSTTSVTVEAAGDLLENDSTFHSEPKGSFRGAFVKQCNDTTARDGRQSD